MDRDAEEVAIIAGGATSMAAEHARLLVAEGTNADPTDVQDADGESPTAELGDMASILQRVSTSLVVTPDGAGVLSGAVLMAAHFERFANVAGSALRIRKAAVASSRPAQPLGTVMLICAPGCDSVTVGENLAAALAAGNRVAISLPGVPDQLMRLLFELLYGVVAAGQFSVLAPESGWTVSSADLSIVVLTPSRAYLNDRPWIAQPQLLGQLTSSTDLIRFYTTAR
jgi:hypothetical protein